LQYLFTIFAIFASDWSGHVSIEQQLVIFGLPSESLSYFFLTGSQCFTFNWWSTANSLNKRTSGGRI